MGCQHHAPAALPLGNNPVPIVLGRVGRHRNLRLLRDSIPDESKRVATPIELSRSPMTVCSTIVCLLVVQPLKLM